MIYTEEQAAEIWCSEVRDDEGRAVRAMNNEAQSWNCCIATCCAHWRWFDPAPDTVDQDGEPIVYMTRRGYCGLSGKPEHAE